MATDHKPLLSILNDRALDTIANSRLVRIKESTLAWLYDIIFVPGGRQAAADALSRKKNMTGLCSLSAGLMDSAGEVMEEAVWAKVYTGSCWST